MADAFLSAFFNVVLDRLFSPEFVNLVQGKKLDQELVQRLKTTLYAAKALLNDAERKQIHDPDVETWLDDLRDAVYVADDLLDHFITKAATQKKVSSFFPRFLNLQDREMANKMEGIVRRLEGIEKRRYVLGLNEISRENLSWRTPSTSLVRGNVYGREDDREAIIKLLLDDKCDAKISVIPIVGMGGVGKTTLAQSIYGDDNLMKEFNLKAWVCISEEFNIVKITKIIIEEVTQSPCNMNELNLLQLDLKERLTGKKFLIVMDDVWNDDSNSWKNLQKPFQYGAEGSKILITTRSKEVASVVQTCPPYHLNELSDEYCWSVFAEHACFPKSNGNPTLEEIGKKIVKKCKGLPLAAETLGSLLKTKHDIKEWNSILTSDIWEFSVKDSKIIPALRISYYYLPPHLKRCFVYCSLYPKDYEFNKDDLILLWMAEDLLRPPKRGETLEEVGYECFNDLTSRLFFKEFRIGNNSFVMHDLMHDLAISIAKDFYFRYEELGKAEELKIQTRHLSYGRLSHPISKNFDTVGRVKSLRTFLPINFSTPSFSIKSVALIAISKFKHLRVLSFRSFRELDVLPDSIGELFHLRYLNLSKTSIETLPESLDNLYNLQTLKLKYCHKLTMLPSGMQNLVNLRHLDIGGTNLKEMPMGLSKLKHLQLLCYFIVGRHEENGIKELGELSNIHGSLRIKNLENVNNSNEALKARIMDKTYVENLYLKWSSDVAMVKDSQTERDILDKLQPHKGLKVLTIKCFRGLTFPNWVGHSSYHDMTCVSLQSCSNCYMLPSLGQLPSLKSLSIAGFNGLETVDDEFYKNDNDHSSLATPFPSLEYLSFVRMSSWEEWRSSRSNAFPQLKRLEIFDCPKLTGDLPNHLPALKILEIRNCPRLTRDLPNLLPALETLLISDCPIRDLPNHLPALETLEINKCEQLVCPLPRVSAIRKLQIYESNEVVLQELPDSLLSLSIEGCKLVESMIEAIAMTQATCLQSLHISNCSSAISFSGGCLPESLKELRINGCRKLEFPKQQQHELLQLLKIENSCDSLTSFPLEIFPNLKSLTIRKCENLQSVSFSQSQPAAIRNLVIGGCPNFVSFPIEGLAAPSMTRFEICRCDRLKSLPSHMNTLPKLQQLDIRDCPEIHSFPEGGLPSSLRHLEIINCEKLLSGLSSMGVHEGLYSLTIEGPCESVKSFPKEGLLPQLPSLTTLTLKRFSCLETLDCKELLHLTSLRTLELHSFSSLETLECKELLHLTSLEKLTIRGCPKLENMTGERLPTSLIILEIYESPLLEERCKMKHPKNWPIISHIRGIKVNGRWVS